MPEKTPRTRGARCGDRPSRRGAIQTVKVMVETLGEQLGEEQAPWWLESGQRALL